MAAGRARVAKRSSQAACFVVLSQAIALTLCYACPYSLLFSARAFLNLLRRNKAAVIRREAMQDLRRLLTYLKSHWGKFTLATVAMLAGAALQSAINALVVPIFDQALNGAQGNGGHSKTLFALQRLIPDSGVAAWRNIAILLILFTVTKGIAEYFSIYFMARVGQERSEEHTSEL